MAWNFCIPKPTDEQILDSIIKSAMMEDVASTEGLSVEDIKKFFLEIISGIRHLATKAVNFFKRIAIDTKDLESVANSITNEEITNFLLNHPDAHDEFVFYLYSNVMPVYERAPSCYENN